MWQKVGETGRQTERTVHGATWSQLKIIEPPHYFPQDCFEVVVFAKHQRFSSYEPYGTNFVPLIFNLSTDTQARLILNISTCILLWSKTCLYIEPSKLHFDKMNVTAELNWSLVNIALEKGFVSLGLMAPSHYLNQYRPGSMTPHGVIRGHCSKWWAD